MIKKLLGYCPMCRRYWQYPKRRRINTAFEDEERNYQTSCMDCYAEAIDYYVERWQEFWNGCM